MLDNYGDVRTVHDLAAVLCIRPLNGARKDVAT